ncbi:MAG: GAF domain-containing protein [Chloroflexota bacterium]|nr:MAG: GAF domain-containing protein [Chloroflexota bacterium]
MKRSVIWRMLAWFLLLALIPLGAVVIFVQRQVNQTVLNVELQAALKQARLFAVETVNHPEELEELTRVFSSAEETAFILGNDGTYLAHSDPQKVGTPGENDFTADILLGFSSNENGSLEDTASDQIIAYASMPDQNTVAVIVKDNQAVVNTLSSLSRSIFLQLSVILLITSIVSGVAILAVIRPLRQLANYADQVGSGNLDATIDQTDLEGEIAVLANSLANMTARLRDLIYNLESKVEERTRNLAIASEVSREITRVLDMDLLLPGLVEKTRQGFNLYYVALYLFDPQTGELTLEAGTGEAGARMKSEGKSFHLETRPSLVAQVARDRQAEIINDTEGSAIYSSNPHLPETRAEAAFPMLISDELIGVLDLQSESAGRFRESDAQIFSTLAEQIAIAIRNAQLYQEQEHVAQELERTDLMKSQFLASMSHELRTPLNSIINFTQLIAMGVAGPVTEEQMTMLNTSLRSSKHLLQLINDVLDINKIQAGKLSLYIEEGVNLKEEIQAVVDMAEPILGKQNATLERPIRFIQDIDDDLPLTACDRRRFRQVLLNLLSNAIKFTEQGTITLSVKAKEEGSLFAVMDTGPGIPLEMQESIFEPFVQATDDIKHTQGTGLGLPISRSLVEAHDGQLWVESNVGEGSIFIFTLPFRPSITQ